eukprot:1093014-Prymnesium_polylepis.1
MSILLCAVWPTDPDTAKLVVCYTRRSHTGASRVASFLKLASCGVATRAALTPPLSHRHAAGRGDPQRLV